MKYLISLISSPAIAIVVSALVLFGLALVLGPQGFDPLAVNVLALAAAAWCAGTVVIARAKIRRVRAAI